MTSPATAVIGGIDTHKHTHYAAVIDTNGRLLGHREFPATDPGYTSLLAWLRSTTTPVGFTGRRRGRSSIRDAGWTGAWSSAGAARALLQCS